MLNILRLVKSAFVATLLIPSPIAQGQPVPQLSLGINHYNAGQYVLDDQLRVGVLPGAEKKMKFRGTEWKAKTTILPVKGNPGAKDVLVNFLCTSGNIKDVSVSVYLTFKNWSVKNYVLIPAAAYNGNRSVVRVIPYCPLSPIQEIPA